MHNLPKYFNDLVIVGMDPILGVLLDYFQFPMSKTDLWFNP